MGNGGGKRLTQRIEAAVAETSVKPAAANGGAQIDVEASVIKPGRARNRPVDEGKNRQSARAIPKSETAGHDGLSRVIDANFMATGGAHRQQLVDERNWRGKTALIAANRSPARRFVARRYRAGKRLGMGRGGKMPVLNVSRAWAA